MLITATENKETIVRAKDALPVRSAAGETGVPGGRTWISQEHADKGSPSERRAAGDWLESLGAMEEVLGGQTERFLLRLEKTPGSPSALISVGLSLINKGDIHAALEYFERAISIDPHNLQAHLGRIRCEVELGDLAKASSDAELIRQEYPNNEALQLAAADILSRLGEHKAAIDALTSLLETVPESLAGRYNRAVQFLLTHRVDRAIADFREAQRIDPRYAPAVNGLGVCYLAIGSMRKALRYLRVVAQLERSPEMLRSLAAALMEAGRRDEAIAIISDALVQFPNDLESSELLARAHWESDNFLLAAQTLSATLREHETGMAPKVAARMHNNLGASLRRMGKDSLAEGHFIQSVNTHVETAIPIINLAALYLSDGRLTSAKELISAYREQFSDNASMVALDGRLALALNDDATAEALFRRALELEPSLIDACIGLGYLLVDHKMAYEEAIEVFTRGLEFEPGNEALQNNLAYSLLMADDIEAAKPIVAGLRDKEEPSAVFCLATKGLLALKQGDLRNGERLYKKAAKAAISTELKRKVVQKMAVEFGRHWLSKDREIARRYLRDALMQRPDDAVYTRQAELLWRKAGSQ